MLRERAESKASQFVFANRDGKPCLGTSINHLHRDACAPKIEEKRRAHFGADFVLHSLRHTMLTGLGESGVDAFAIMRIAGRCGMGVSLRYIHPALEAVRELSSGCNSQARIWKRSRNDCHPLQYPLHSRGRLP
jgi:hypothetical protein